MTNQTRLDSLMSEFQTAEAENGKWEILSEISDFLNDSIATEERDSIWNQLIHLCQTNEYKSGEYRCKYSKGKDLRNNGNFFESLQLFNESIQYFESVDSLGVAANIYNSLGIFYKSIRDFEQSEKHYKMGMQISRQLSDTVQIAYFLINLGSLAEEQERYTDALDYLSQAEKILKQHDQKNLINCYINFGDVYNVIENTDSAFYYLSLANQLANENNFVEEQFHSAFHLALFLFDQEKPEEAEPLLNKAERLNEEYIIGDFSLDDQIRFFDLLSNYYSSKNNYRQAYEYSLLTKKLETQNKRELFNEERNRISFEKQVQEEESNRKRSELISIIALSTLLISIVFILLLFRNYKHKQKANRLLREMDELKTRMFSDISHELRTPLTMIIAPLEQMLSKEAGKNPSRKQIKLMRKNANAILSLVNQILDLSKIDAKSMKLELSESDIVSFIRAHFASFASLAAQKQINFNTYTPPDNKIRLFDASKLEKIINNLISNALKYTPEGGQVFCFASFPEEKRLELVIQDTGSGIPAEDLPKIFDRFHRVSGSDSTSHLGTGIGLSLTKELVELMYGQITVESIVGEGTKFKVSLPLGKEHLQKDEFELLSEFKPELPVSELPDEEPGKCEDPASSENGEAEAVILIVEDHIEISDFIAENLRSCYKVISAPNGKKGLVKATESIPDLIISDVMMPEMNGVEMSRKLKKDERTSHIPIILLTAKSSQADKIEGLETGVDAFLQKPFNMKELALRVKKLIEQRRKLRERFTKNLNLEPREIAVSSADEKFLNRVMDIIEKEMSNTEFEVNQLQDEMLMSRTQLFRKIKALTNQSPGEFIRTVRLKRAAQLMDKNFGNIAQITYEVGFNNPSYFAKCFKELFGVLPSEYMKKK